MDPEKSGGFHLGEFIVRIVIFGFALFLLYYILRFFHVIKF